ncbi:DUF5107 domain-containing protein [Ilyomonas limi]|uniref:DUF5107 domain-containing protein n=1 Tax=Ilyomonas limi TaxID=2575867 RepID=A0A4U3L182_9BACT|nr:DUF5107 domain-containing protein [Ilyomonas limi]TKK67969.1 DUF5107 domain-containing protein [Ilyomonas limi]
MKKLWMLLILLAHFGSATSQYSVTVKEYLKTFPTYPFSDPNPIPLLTQVYPYFRFDGFTDKAVNKQWKVVEIENAYIKILILPEIGGKIWAAIDKKTSKPFLYYNHAVKFRDVAMRGPWTSGGLESNFGIIGHTPNCATPVDYTVQHEEDGSITCTIGALDLLTRSNWRMEINVPKDKAFFTTQAFWYNTTPAEQPYYHWMNAAAKASNDLEFIYPGNKYLGHNGEYASWPVNKQNGKRISWYKENDFGGYKSYHVFGKYTNFFGTYYHDEDMGMARYSTHDDKAGKKIWIWGLSGQGMIWEKELTDTDGQYVEVQSGRLFNQNAEGSSYTPFKHIAFEPYASDSWKEYWYPVNGTKGFVEANQYGAFNMKYEDGWLKLYYFPVQALQDTLVVKENDKIAYKKALHLLPEQVFKDSIQVAADINKLTVTIGIDKLQYNADSSANALSRPVETPTNFNWNNAYGLYLLGSELMNEKLYAKAEENLTASLQQDSNFLPALVKMSELMYRNMRYKEALQLATRALSINSVAGDANYYYGLVNEQSGNVVDAKDGFDIAALDPAYRSAAYTELASIYHKEKTDDKALHYLQKALVYNAHNIAALQLQAVIYRQQHNRNDAQKVLAIILQLDPLSHFALFEKYQWNKTENNKQEFIQSIKNELPAETYAELAIWYHKQGCIEEAKQLFTLSLPSPESVYWLAYLNGEKVDVSKMDVSFYFPFRSETAGVIATLMKQQEDWLLKYHLALIYHDRNRIAECKQLLMTCGNDPQFAPFYAVRAAIERDSNTTSAATDLQTALSLSKDWRYYKLLAEHYLATAQNDKALAVIEPYAKAHPGNYIIGLLYTKALLFNNRLREADKIISKLNILPFEGATESHDVYREVKLREAMDALISKDYKKSISFIQQALLYPENLGVGKPYEEDIDHRLENWLLYLNHTALNNKTAAEKDLQNIIHFAVSDNNERNIQSSNALVTVWAYEKMNEKEKGNEWLSNEIAQQSNDKGLSWVKAMLEHGTTSGNIPPGSNERVLYYLMNKIK